jgi:hypothetical protein
MNAPVFPTNPTVGQRWMNWTWNGARWVCSPMAGVQVICTVFYASGPYQPSPGLVSVTVECIGPGGGGGDCYWNGGYNGTPVPPATGDRIVSGGGGGSGGYSRKTLPASLVLGGVGVTIGQGGPGNYPGTGPTSFGAFCVANPGGAGPGYNGINQWGGPGLGAPVGVGDLAFPGVAGTMGSLMVRASIDPPLEFVGIGGQGGSIFGGGGGTGVPQYVGAASEGVSAAPNTGGGGAGGFINQLSSTTQYNGGQGGSGLCWVTEFCWSDVADEDCGCGSSTGMARVARLMGPGPWPGGWDD